MCSPSLPSFATAGACTSPPRPPFRVPGVKHLCPARCDARGNYYVDLVPHALGLTPCDPRNPEHRTARRVPFLIDTGAEMSLVGPESMALLAQINIHPRTPITGFSGAASVPLATGNLVIVPPPGAVAVRRRYLRARHRVPCPGAPAPRA